MHTRKLVFVLCVMGGVIVGNIVAIFLVASFLQEVAQVTVDVGKLTTQNYKQIQRLENQYYMLKK